MIKSSFLFLPALLIPALGSSPSHSTTPPAVVKYVMAPAGNLARFKVRETLVGAELPNDAIGTTTAISGSITLDDKGKVDPKLSSITVLLDSLKTDQARRDGYIKSRTFQTAQFPKAVLVITDIQGLPAKMPTSGALALTIVGDLTIHGVTKSTTWKAAATANANGLSGTAGINLKFEDFNMTQPSVPIVLGVVDDIRLEYDFNFVKG